MPFKYLQILMGARAKGLSTALISYAHWGEALPWLESAGFKSVRMVTPRAFDAGRLALAAQPHAGISVSTTVAHLCASGAGQTQLTVTDGDNGIGQTTKRWEKHREFRSGVRLAQKETVPNSTLVSVLAGDGGKGYDLVVLSQNGSTGEAISGGLNSLASCRYVVVVCQTENLHEGGLWFNDAAKALSGSHEPVDACSVDRCSEAVLFAPRGTEQPSLFMKERLRPSEPNGAPVKPVMVGVTAYGKDEGEAVQAALAIARSLAVAEPVATANQARVKEVFQEKPPGERTSEKDTRGRSFASYCASRASSEGLLFSPSRGFGERSYGWDGPGGSNVSFPFWGPGSVPFVHEPGSLDPMEHRNANHRPLLVGVCCDASGLNQAGKQAFASLSVAVSEANKHSPGTGRSYGFSGGGYNAHASLACGCVFFVCLAGDPRCLAATVSAAALYGAIPVLLDQGKKKASWWSPFALSFEAIPASHLLSTLGSFTVSKVLAMQAAVSVAREQTLSRAAVYEAMAGALKSETGKKNDS